MEEKEAKIQKTCSVTVCFVIQRYLKGVKIYFLLAS